MTTLAVLWPTPGRASNSSKVRGTWPPWQFDQQFGKVAEIALAFCGASPQERMIAWISGNRQPRHLFGVSAAANRAGVTWLTRLSVHWADRSDGDQSV